MRSAVHRPLPKAQAPMSADTAVVQLLDIPDRDEPLYAHEMSLIEDRSDGLA
jgi:hypothetical protein